MHTIHRSNRFHSPSVGVVLLNWNGGEFTMPCIQSLLAGTVTPDIVVVVDNASSDGSAERITDEFPEVYLIRNQTNRGFTGGNNQGIQYLLQQTIEYIWVLNNDTTVAPNCLEKLLAAALRHPTVAGFSAKIYYDNPMDRLWYAGAFRHRWHLGVKHYLDARLDQEARGGIVLVPFISGCCMFVPAWAWLRYGTFLEDYVAYGEDNEWCWRVIETEIQLHYVPDAVLWHRLSASVIKNTGRRGNNGITPRAWFLMCRNQLWTVKLHSKGTHRLVALSTNTAIMIRNAIYWYLQGKTDESRACVKGLVIGLLKNPTRNTTE